jgi:predicted dinucleotide-binding enzyme
MSTSIIGFGAVGQALARAFARKNIQVTVATRRPAEAIALRAKEIGPTVIASSLQDALKAAVVILALPFGLQDELAKAADWQGKIVIDATNAYGVPPDNLGGLPSSVVNAQALVGSRLVKAADGSFFCQATTTTRLHKWRPWSSNSASHLSCSASSQRAVYLSRLAETLGLS